MLLLLLQVSLAIPTCEASVCDQNGRGNFRQGSACTSVERFINDLLRHCSFALQGALQQ